MNRSTVALLCLLALSAGPRERRPARFSDFERVMQNLADGWNRGDARKAADCFTEDAIYREPPD